MLKKKLISVALMAALGATMFVGCGEDDKNSKKDDAATTAATEVTTEAAADNSASGSASAAVVGELNAVSGEEDKYSAEDIAAKFPTENIRIYGEMTDDSMGDASMFLDVGSVGDDGYMVMSMDVNGTMNELKMYSIGSDVYSYMSMLGESVYSHATATSKEETEGLMDSGFDPSQFTGDNISAVKYVGTQTIDDVEHDVVNVTSVDEYEMETTSVVYINNDTGNIDAVTPEDTEGVIKIEAIDKITLPEEFTTETITESTVEDISMQVFGFVFGLASSAEGGLEGLDSDMDIQTEVEIADGDESGEIREDIVIEE